MPTVKQIAEKIDSRSKNFKIGKLQEIRTKIKNLDRTPGKKIFNNKTIKDGYAFHYGGRKELQFNIGEEDNSYFRWGVAFSFERSQTLPDVTILIPKITKFNQFIRKFPKKYSDMIWWYYKNGIRSKNYKAGTIDSNILNDVAHKGVFIFFGKLRKENSISYDEILKDFDRLLPLYKYVESEHKIKQARRGGLEIPTPPIVPTPPVVSTPVVPRSENEILKQLFDEDEMISSNTTPTQKKAIRKIRVRNSKALKSLKELYRGKCQLTGEQFTFKKMDGTIYSEAHHLIPLGKKGSDSIFNLVVVSPLIHKMLHYANVTPIDLTRIKNNRLTITINGTEYTITWHPRHARSIAQNLQN